MNADTGAILYEKNGYDTCYPASTTKVATISYALQQIEDHLDREVTAEQDDIGSVTAEAKKKANYTLPAYWLETGTGHMGIKRGETLSLRVLVYGTMLPSAGDASNIIARYVGGSIPKFMEQLNAYVEGLGCTGTHFMNPHGLFHPNHYTTPYDLALITKEALKNPTFREVIATTQYRRPKTNKQEPAPMVQSNRLLRQGKHYYPKAIGVKTGYIAAAQHCLVAAATNPKDQRTLIAVLMKCKERENVFRDAVALFEAAFQQPKLRQVILHAGPQQWVLPVEGSSKGIRTQLFEDVSIDFYPAERPKLRCFLQPHALQNPVEEGDQVGIVELVEENGNVYKSVAVYAYKEEKVGLLQRLSQFFLQKAVLMGITVSLLLGFFFLRR